MRECSKTFEWARYDEYDALFSSSRKTVEVHDKGFTIRQTTVFEPERYIIHVEPEEIDSLITALITARAEGIRMFGRAT